MRSARACVIGTGAWGTTLAALLAEKGIPVRLWARTEEEARTLQVRRENRRFLPGKVFPDALSVTHDPEQGLEGADLVLLVVPAQTMRENAERIAPLLPVGATVVSAAKGLEIDTRLRISQVLEQAWGAERSRGVCALSGPNLAREIAAGLPASTVVASRDAAAAAAVQEALTTPRFRVYAHDDIVGVELAGALKNIVALGAGAADAFGFGDNAKAALMSRGLAEIARLGVAAGANPLTFAGLAGFGDLVCTCTSRHSRNRHVGEELAKGRTWDEIRRSMHQVAEGVYTAVAARQLAQDHGVEMPITETIYQVIFRGLEPQQAVDAFFARPSKRELEGHLEAWLERVEG